MGSLKQHGRSQMLLVHEEEHSVVMQSEGKFGLIKS